MLTRSACARSVRAVSSIILLFGVIACSGSAPDDPEMEQGNAYAGNADAGNADAVSGTEVSVTQLATVDPDSPVELSPWFDDFALLSAGYRGAQDPRIQLLLDASGQEIDVGPRIAWSKPSGEAGWWNLVGDRRISVRVSQDEEVVELLEFGEVVVRVPFASPEFFEDRLRYLMSDDESTFVVVQPTPTKTIPRETTDIKISTFDTRNLDRLSSESIQLADLDDEWKRPWLFDLSADGRILWVISSTRGITNPSLVTVVAEGFDLKNASRVALRELYRCDSSVQYCVAGEVGVFANGSMGSDVLWLVITPDLMSEDSPTLITQLDTRTGEVINETSDWQHALRIGLTDDESQTWVLSEAPDRSQLLLQQINTIDLSPVGQQLRLPQLVDSDPGYGRSQGSFWATEPDYRSHHMWVSADSPEVWIRGLDSDYLVEVDGETGGFRRQALTFVGSEPRFAAIPGSSLLLHTTFGNGVAVCLSDDPRQLVLEPYLMPCSSRDRIPIESPGSRQNGSITVSVAPDESSAWIREVPFWQGNEPPKQTRGHLIDLQTKQLVRSVDLEGAANSPVWSPDGRQMWFLNSSSPRVDILDAQSGVALADIRTQFPASNFGWVEFSPDGRGAIVGSKHPDYSQFLWDVLDTTTLETTDMPLQIGNTENTRPVFTPSPLTVWTGAPDDVILGIDPLTGEETRRLPLPNLDAPQGDQCLGREVSAISQDPMRLWINAWCGRLVIIDSDGATEGHIVDLDGDIQEMVTMPSGQSALVLTSTRLYRIDIRV